jgi:hypothetical protein
MFLIVRLPLALLISLILAETLPEGFSFMPLINIGAVGVILAFVLWKLEPRMRGAECAIDRLTRAIAIMLTELPHVLEGAKRQCSQLNTELDDAARARGDKRQ